MLSWFAFLIANGVSAELGLLGEPEIFTPKVSFTRFKNAADKYPESLMVVLPYRGKELEIDLRANLDLFDENWALEEYALNGTLLRRVTDRSGFSCHYLGEVTGYPGSVVAASFCDGLGLSASIDLQEEHQTIGLLVRKTAEIPIAGGDHSVRTIYTDEVDRNAPPDARFGGGTYVNKEAIISDEYRVKDAGGSNAEAKSTQASVNQANKFYTSTNWGNGVSIANKIALQQQTPPNWPKHNKPYPTSGTAGKPFRSYFAAHLKGNHGATGGSLINGYSGAWPGSHIGESCTGCVCGNSATANFRAAKPSANGDDVFSLGMAMAHEWGHRLGMNHDKDHSACFAMNVHGCHQKNTKQFFSPASISAFNQNKGKMGCLLGDKVVLV
jgi:hypothetical protein